ncbi:MAG: PDZ domain-containing protein [Planctomycetota bacterium]|nr:PDZ domain-containing protein [Planctomycetota bacterium]
MAHGYYRQPTLHRDRVVFVCEDDLWTVPASGGVPRRLTSGQSEASSPSLSPDGKWLAFVGREEGHSEVYTMPADGGAAERRTFLGAGIFRIAGWSRDGRRVLFATNARQALARIAKLFSVDRAGGEPREEPYGLAHFVSFGSKGAVLGRHGGDPARWKRYRGGTAGQLWIDRAGRGEFARLIETGGNPSAPMWIGGRIYFLCDHEGAGNLYSCTPDGQGLKRHTQHLDFYVRFPSSDGRRIVYQAGAELYLFDPRAGRARKLAIDWKSPRTQRQRKFVEAAAYLEDYAPHPKGEAVALTARGRVASMGAFEGAAIVHGEREGVRYRLGHWLKDGKRLVAVTDLGGAKDQEQFVIFHADGSAPPKLLGPLDVGRPRGLAVSPAADVLAVANHRHELHLVDLAARKARPIDRSRHGQIAGAAFSPDGAWLAYGYASTPHTGVIRLCPTRGGKPFDATRPVAYDFGPSFDPDGKYLYFLSTREFNPVYDTMYFQIGFPRMMRPYLVALGKETKSPFTRDGEPGPDQDAAKKDGKKKKRGQDDAPEPLKLDRDGLAERILPFPVPEARYGQIAGIAGGAVFTSYEVEGALGRSWASGDPQARAKLEVYKFDDAKADTLVNGITNFKLSADAKTLLYRAGNRLRSVKAGEKPNDKDGESARKSGWIDLKRARIEVNPPAEWRQMYLEAWRLMRDHFWVEDMSGVDWRKVRDRYLPLLERVASRGEFSDLVWEMQGETGTSHAYELGGDYRRGPSYPVGKLGCAFIFDRKKQGYRIAEVVHGDAWDPNATSPLNAPGLKIGAGDVVTAINGRGLTEHLPPEQLLVHQAGQEVVLTLAGGRRVTVKAAGDETQARYRDWVNRNRARVHERTRGRVGYLHVPDMSPFGYAEFHRQYLGEVDRDALLVDVRFNGGGHVSQLLLEKLRRRIIGWDQTRWTEPMPYPMDGPRGPLVALTNELAGSDGDIFSHCFKLYGLGPLVGRRTWGGVIGISPSHRLADGSITTQPEYSFWFEDVGFGVENYGTDPDIDVDMAPQDYARGKDPQLEKALEVLLDLLKQQPPKTPDFGARPKLHLPTKLKKA